MIVIFCAHQLEHGAVDECFEEEAAAVSGLGIEYALLDLDALISAEQSHQAVRSVRFHPNRVNAVYRGWMMKPEHYRSLYEALVERNVYLINDPQAYIHCHYLPEYYHLIENQTAKTVWTGAGEKKTTGHVMNLIHTLGAQSVIVKDYVKSQKHYWNDAFFIPDASDKETVERVVGEFLRLQGEDLNVGLVFREFVLLEPLGAHRRSDMPTSLEYRIFFIDGRPIFSGNYWSDGEYAGREACLAPFLEIAGTIKSRFFTMDIAKKRDEGWIIVELGDAQVSDLPPGSSIQEFYHSLQEYIE
ncbi:MAG: ATP-grasp domain-containing protein [Candidatus Xenobiia bacterium LiM19]